MDKFEATTSGSPKNIKYLIENLVGEPNKQIFLTSNLLTFQAKLNPEFTSQAIKDLIKFYLNPICLQVSSQNSEFHINETEKQDKTETKNTINNDNENKSENTIIYTPLNSYRWFYLFFSLISHTFEDTELEKGKNLYVSKFFQNAILNSDFKNPNNFSLLVGIISCFARFIYETHFTVDNIPLFLKLLNVFTQSESTSQINSTKNYVPISLDDFSEPDLYSFFCPISIDYIPHKDVFLIYMLVF